jgi:imidazolonepropionase
VIADFLVLHADELLTAEGPAPRIGRAMADVRRVPDGALAARSGRIVFVGGTAECERTVTPLPDATVLDARGCALVPGFVDPHTHVVYAGERHDELKRRLAGATYAEIAAAGGGILSTVRATRAASVDDLVEASSPRLAEMLRCGTTTAEVKSGYGLTVEAELDQLRAIRRLGELQPVDLSATFLGAHEVPPEWRDRRDDYVRLVVEGMIPAVAREGLAEWCDVFCERGVFTPEESTAILAAGLRGGLKARIHANELGPSGGAHVAARLGARSADHLVFVDEADARALAASGVVATLLPAAAFYLKLGRYAPARLLIDAGVGVALASDVNPGGGLTPSMPFVMTLACFAMGLTFEEALTAGTLNAAFALDRSDDVGSLEVGKSCDAVIVEGPAVALLRVGAGAIQSVVKRGRVAYATGEAAGSQNRQWAGRPVWPVRTDST